ncbi:MG2 domain-containing protein [Ideonella sp. DXS29W]|uniref:MG2 domain-containing protein n=1 Tax=Ideonella lacteola TaxID=2984193 RepID=A0ABU9BJT5_9BURK
MTSTLLRRAWLACALTFSVLGPAAVVAQDDPPLPNYRSPFVGEPFFLLSDATFGGGEAAKVRLEINNPDQLSTVGGVDVVLYRVPEPLGFLQKQRNLHRIQVEAKPVGEGLANTLTHLWDSWVVKARIAWQKLFSGDARRAVTAQAPELKTSPQLTRPSNFEEPPQFKPLPGLPVVDRFRYPVHLAKPIEPPKDLKLAGSSSEFIQPSSGNVFIPLGPQKPGLYLVEAMAGQHRATTLVFVSDTLALTKVSGAQMVVWSAHRAQGAAVPSTKVVWTDGVGVLKTGSTDAQGLLRMDRPAAPEQTYVFGEDPAGGVFISENFYYDSEIYNAKVYATTDRPLYRPGDSVFVKVTGREFKNARESVALADGDIGLVVRDPAGQVVATQTMKFSSASGADGRFQLPDNAAAGGYEMMLTLRGDNYTAAFRVADYQKPHFEIQWLPDKADFATGDEVAGAIQLNYPDGKPVANARLSLSARAQALSMIEGELDYSGAFALKLSQDELVTDGSGQARFKLPAAEQPSRYVLTVLATDGAAYRVRSTRELLVERGSAGWLLTPQRQFSKPNESLAFRWSPSRRAADATPGQPTTWEWLRLEDRQRASGNLAAGGNASGGSVDLSFPQPGSYTVTLRDAQKRIVAATSHWVAGEGLKAPAGSIGIVFDKARYNPGETAEALVTFPEPVDQALLTIERERVDAAALLTRGGEGFTTERLGPTQWRVRVPVTAAMSPNVTVSVAYAKHGDSVFQNQGLSVVQPRVAIEFKTDKPVYAPGEVVNVDVSTTVGGKPVAAEVAVGVVDEMIYVLQPEIAPTIDDFFYHPRRNNVRTSVSLSFIGYDLATNKLGELPGRRGEPQRAIKVLERPRRDNVDTAAWEPRLRTDASGRTRFSFKMPDSLTRWRLTGRAVDAQGLVGQQTAWVRSDKAFYAKWTSPDWQRVGDRADASIALFNQGRDAQEVEWSAQGGGVSQQGKLSLKPGANFVTLPLSAEAAGALDLTVTLRHQGKVVDSLSTPLQRVPVAWSQPRELMLDLSSGPAALSLPADARNVRVTLASDPAVGAFSRWVDELVEYPYGCVEQTASRMLPLSIALQSLSAAQQPLAPMLTHRLSTARLSLAQMAGPQAQFGWWGRGMADDPFLTAYAYYADWRATQALKAPLPASHWQRLLDVYAKDGAKASLLQRALALHWMQEMGLPVASMVDALVEELVAAKPDEAAASARGSVVMRDEASRDVALVLAAYTAGPRASAPQRAEADAAAARLAASPSVLVQSLLVLVKKGGAAQANALLAQVRGEQPTFDRAQSLLWLQKAIGGTPDVRAEAGSLPAPWVAARGGIGQPVWTLPAGATKPTTLAATGGAKVAFVAFDSSEASASPALPVQIERKLFRVVPQAKPKADAASTGTPPDGRMTVKLEPVAPGTVLDTNTLYLDALTVSGSQPLRWGLLEVALPPGAGVESGTWGLDVLGADGAQSTPLERAIHQATRQGYAVPVEKLGAGESVTVRHLLRFSQRGRYQLPPSRLYRMYEPEAKAVEVRPGWAMLEVR